MIALLLIKLQRFYIKIRLLKNWPRIIMPLSGERDMRNFIAVLRNGLVLRVNSVRFDMPILYQIFWHHIYDGLETIAAKEPHILDVGGHIGFFAVFAARRLPRAHIYVFEPDPSNIRLLTENIERSNCGAQITVIPKALCDNSGDRILFRNPENTSSNNLYLKNTEKGISKEVHVQCVTLEQILQEYGIVRFDYAKFDCEGSEYEILLNASDTALEALPYMVIEWHGHAGYRPEALVSHLTAKGYDVSFSQKPRIIVAKRITK